MNIAKLHPKMFTDIQIAIIADEKKMLQLQTLLRKYNINIKNTENKRDFLIELLTKNIMTCKKYVFKKIKNIPISKRFEDKVILYMELSYKMEVENLIESYFKEEHFAILTGLLTEHMFQNLVTKKNINQFIKVSQHIKAKLESKFKQLEKKQSLVGSPNSHTLRPASNYQMVQKHIQRLLKIL